MAEYLTSRQILSEIDEQTLQEVPESIIESKKMKRAMLGMAAKKVGANVYDNDELLDRVIWRRTYEEGPNGTRSKVNEAIPKDQEWDSILADAAYTALNMAPADFAGVIGWKGGAKAAAKFGLKRGLTAIPIVGGLASAVATQLATGNIRQDIDPLNRGISLEEANSRLNATNPILGAAAEFAGFPAALATWNAPALAKNVKNMLSRAATAKAPISLGEQIAKGGGTALKYGGVGAGLEALINAGANTTERISNFNTRNAMRDAGVLFPEDIGRESSSLTPVFSRRALGTGIGAGLGGLVEGAIGGAKIAQKFTQANAGLIKSLQGVSPEQATKVLAELNQPNVGKAEILEIFKANNINPVLLEAAESKGVLDGPTMAKFLATDSNFAPALAQARQGNINKIIANDETAEIVPNETVDKLVQWAENRKARGFAPYKRVREYPGATTSEKKIAQGLDEGWLDADKAQRANAILEYEMGLGKERTKFNKYLADSRLNYELYGEGKSRVDVDLKAKQTAVSEEYNAKFQENEANRQVYLEAIEQAGGEPSREMLKEFDKTALKITEQHVAALEELNRQVGVTQKELTKLPFGDNPSVQMKVDKRMNEITEAEKQARLEAFMKEYGLSDPHTIASPYPGEVPEPVVPKAPPTTPEQMKAEIQKRSRPKTAADVMEFLKQ